MKLAKHRKSVGKLLVILFMLNLVAILPSPTIAAQGGQSAPGPEAVLVAGTRYNPYHVPAPSLPTIGIQAATITVNFNPAACFPGSIDPWPQNAMTAFTFATNIWASLINSNQTIVVDACWRSDLGKNILGSTRATDFRQNFANAPVANTDYPMALANALANSDLNGATSELTANFSSTYNWYFGTDGNTPATQYDFASVVLHEVGHGLGFAGSARVDTGNNACNTSTTGDGCIALSGTPRAYDRFTEDSNGTRLLNYTSPSAALGNALTNNPGGVFFNGANANAANGARVRLYTPSAWNQGSSYSHLAESFNNTPNALMTYSLDLGESVHNPGPVTLGILRDIGWGLEQTDLSISKTASPDPAIAGTNLTYTLQVTNGGPNEASNVVVTDNLPFGVSLVSMSAGCSGTFTITCELGNLASGAGATIAIVVAVPPATPPATILTNTATVTGNETDQNINNNTASSSTTVARQADLVITKTDTPDPIVLGNDLTYTIAITNNGPSDASNIVVTDSLPKNVAFVPGACSETTAGSGVVNCSLSSLASGSSATFGVVVKPLPIAVIPNQTGTITNTASVLGSEPDLIPANNASGAITTTVTLPSACDLGGPNVIMGTPGDDLLIGTAGDDVILGMGGNDRIMGQEGNDCLDGGDGRDTIGGDAGNDLIFGRGGSDTIVGDSGDDLIAGGDSKDLITGSTGNDVIYGDAGSDQIDGNDGDDLIAGDTGADSIDGGPGSDRIFGGDSGDHVIGGTGNDVISGDAGSDKITGNDGDDLIAGNDGTDTIEGSAGNDQIFGGDNNDRLSGGTGNDIVKGDLGDDRLQGNDGADDLDGGLDRDQLDGGGDADVCVNGEQLVSCES